MTVRLLTVLALTFPLCACAAQPAARADGGPVQAAPVPAAAPASAAAVAPPTSAGAAPETAPPTQDKVAPAPAHARPATPASARAASPSPAAAAAPSAAAPAPAESTETAASVPAVVAPAAPVATPPAPVTMPAGTPTASLLQTLFALILVLAVLAALAWFLKRYGPRASGGTAHLRVVGSLSLGGRERLLVVEIGNQWVVVGASPGRVNALATMPRQEGVEGANATLAPHAPAANSFADWLKQTIDKRK